MDEKLDPTAASLLGFLNNGSMTGWTVFELCKNTIGAFWNVTRSQVYRELNDLARRGLVKEGKSGPRGRTPYTITAAGRRAFGAWLDSPPSPDIVRSPLLLTVFFGAQLPPDRFAAMLAAQRAHHATNLERYELLHGAIEQGGDPYVSATVDFGARHERMIVEWLDALVASTGEK